MRKLENRNLVEATIRKAAHEAGIKIHIIEVLPDHMHLLVTLPRGMTDEDALRRLKGRSAYLIFRNKPSLAASFWNWKPPAEAGCSKPKDIGDFQ